MQAAVSSRCCERPGFEKIKIAPKDTSRSFIRERLPGKQIEDYLGNNRIREVRGAHGERQIRNSPSETVAPRNRRLVIDRHPNQFG